MADPKQNCDNYKKRGIVSKEFWKNNKELISILSNLSKDKYTLDLRLRGNLIHAYYHGGKILEITTRTLQVDDKYLRNYPQKESLLHKWFESEKHNDEYKWKLDRKAVLENINNYLFDMQDAMNFWFERNSNNERSDQQRISMAPQKIIKIVDIEYAVSANSHCYNFEYMSTQKKKADSLKGQKYQPYKRWPNPRFDIIGIDDTGQIYVFELKTGLDSTNNMIKHITDFVNLIGSQDKDRDGKIRFKEFNAEMGNIISTFNEHSEIFNKNKYPEVNTNLPPKFYFLFSNKEGENDFYEFQKKVTNCFDELLKDEESALYRSLIKNGILNSKAIHIDQALNYIINLPI